MSKLSNLDDHQPVPLEHRDGGASLRVSNDDELTVKLVPTDLPLAGDPGGRIVKTDTTYSLKEWQ